MARFFENPRLVSQAALEKQQFLVRYYHPSRFYDANFQTRALLNIGYHLVGVLKNIAIAMADIGLALYKCLGGNFNMAGQFALAAVRHLCAAISQSVILVLEPLYWVMKSINSLFGYGKDVLNKHLTDCPVSVNPVDGTAYKDDAKLPDGHLDFFRISDAGKERVRRGGAKLARDVMDTIQSWSVDKMPEQNRTQSAVDARDGLTEEGQDHAYYLEYESIRHTRVF